nr:hypothetical protein [Tanacetum cinerariifolium]
MQHSTKDYHKHIDEVWSFPEHLKDKSGLAASAKLTWAKLNKHSRDADLLKDKSGPESPPEFQRDGMSKDMSGPELLAPQIHSASKMQRTPSKNKEPTHLKRSRRLEDQSITKEKARRERSESRRKRFGHQETSSDSKHEEGLEDAYEDLNSPYKRPKPALFTQSVSHDFSKVMVIQYSRALYKLS